MTLVKYNNNMYKYIDTIFINCADAASVGIKAIIAPIEGGAIQAVDIKAVEYVAEEKSTKKQALHS